MESVSSSSRKRNRSNSTSISTSTSTTTTTTTTSSNELNTGTSTANNRVQQSCTKCRARKIKCDLKSPCSNCILRGRQQECEYARTDEDRYQISQAKEIENLRREINKLKRRLESDGPQTQSRPRGGLEVSEDQPNRRIRHPDGRVTYLWNSTATDAQMESHHKPMPMPMPMAQPVQQQHQSFGQAGFEPYSSDANTYVHNRAFPIENTPQYGSSQYSLSQFQQNQHPDYWRGKQWHLETIYKIVCDCDEFWVPSIIDIVRNSLSPEEAIVSIRELLRSGLAGGSNNTGNYAYQSSGSSGAPYQAASASTTSASHSSSRSPDSGWSTGITDAPSASYRHAEYTGTINDNLSPTQQSQSSTEF